MNTKTLKIVTTILMVIFTVCSVSQVALASSVVNGITANTKGVDAEPLQQLAGKILGLIQMILILKKK